MQLIDDLRAEHETIERVALSLLGFLESAHGTAAEAREYVEFFSCFAGEWHHEREEQVLVPSLVEALHLPATTGPIAVLLEDHRRMASLLGAMRRLAADTDFDRDAWRGVAAPYVQTLLAHLDMENSVLFPECELRLRRGGVRELTSRSISERERRSFAAGNALALLHPPLENLDQIRGEGCVMCPSYGDSCAGIEREWWNEWEWEERDEHVAAS